MKRIEFILLVVGMLTIAGLAVYSHRSGEKTATAEFHRLADNSVEALDERMQNYLHSLVAVAAFYRGSDDVTAAEFQSFVQDLDIEQTLPGINGLGLIVPVPADEVDAFERDMQINSYREYEVHPKTDAAESFIVKYISPYGPNAEALGLDIAFEDGRRRAAARARRLGQAQLTPRLELVQDTSEDTGFVLLYPISRTAMSSAGDNTAQGAFVGWIFAPFVGRNLLSNLTPDQGFHYNLKVYDGREESPGNLIFDGHDADGFHGAYSSTVTIEKFGRPWTVHYFSTAEFDRSVRSYVPYFIICIGLLSIVLLLAWQRFTGQRAAALMELAKLRERQITAQGEENRSIVENAVTPVFILDERDEITFSNQAARKCFEYSETELLGMAFSKIARGPGKDPQAENPDYASGRTRDGRMLVLDLQRNSWTTARGEKRITAIVRDITAQTNLQAYIERTKTLYDLALQGSHIGVFDIDLVSGKSDVSDTWCRIMGFNKECNGLDTQREFLARIHPEDRNLLTKADEDCIMGRTSRSISEYRMLFGKNEWRWMRSDAVVAQRDAAGKALRLIGTQSDITEERHARNALEASEEQFRRVLSAAPIGMALMDDKGEFIGVNDALCALCGVSREVLVSGYKLSDILYPDDLAAMYRDIQAMMAEGQTEPYMAEHKLIQDDVKGKWGLFHVSWTHDKNAGRHVFIAQVVDITEQKRVEQIKNEFVSTVSHELRTPLTSIKGALGLITASKENGQSQPTKRLLEIASSNVDRLTSIVNDILDLEKISSGEVAFDIGPANLSDILHDAANELLPFAQTHKNKLLVQLPSDPLMVAVDPSRTRQVLANLISNACKYSDNDSDVQVVAEQLDGMAIIYVINKGPGIPDSFRPRIFEAFSQADGSDTRVKGGTGLGLNISRQIVTRQGGKIGFESRKDNMTVFWFTCPLSKSVANAPPIKLVAQGTVPQPRATVLHLENDRDFADVVRSGLKPHADVIHAESIRDARSILGRLNLDVILLDWSLPDGDASSLLDEILALHPEACILGLSADGERGTDPRIKANMVKTRADLDDVVQQVLGNSAKAS
ncbi:MAG: CHASE domain-containing protein [Sulfitobacter sp.]